MQAPYRLTLVLAQRKGLTWMVPPELRCRKHGEATALYDIPIYPSLLLVRET